MSPSSPASSFQNRQLKELGFFQFAPKRQVFSIERTGKNSGKNMNKNNGPLVLSIEWGGVGMKRKETISSLGVYPRVINRSAEADHAIR